MKKVFCFLCCLLLMGFGAGCCNKGVFLLTLDGKIPPEGRIYYAAGSKKLGGGESIGYYCGPGVSNGYFSPQKAGQGRHVIKYIHWSLFFVYSASIEVFGEGIKSSEKIKEHCNKCQDEGKIQCPKCCGIKENIKYKRCSICLGDGFLDATSACMSCNKTGKKGLWGKCSKCNGKGQLPIPCSKCKDGKLPCCFDGVILCDECSIN